MKKTPETNYQHILRANEKIDSIIEGLAELRSKMDMIVDMFKTAQKIKEELKKVE